MAQAAITIHTRWQLKSVRQLMDRLQPPRLNWALRNAVNDTAKQLERYAEREIAKRTSLPKRRVKAGVFIRPFATDQLLEATLRGSASQIPLKVFRAKEQGKGVSARIWGKRQQYNGAFIMGGRKGNRVPLKMGGHVFERVGPSWIKQGGKWRHGPIRRVAGLSISQAMTEQAVSKSIVDHANERMMVNLARQLDRYTRSRGKK